MYATNYLPDELLKKANAEAIFNLYLYLVHKKMPFPNETLQSVLYRLKSTARFSGWTNKELYRLKILDKAISSSSFLSATRIQNLTFSKSGMTACIFEKPDKSISVVFRGTGEGEWIDNGEGLSGIPEKNTYITYAENVNTSFSNVIREDYATGQQVEALNWFLLIAAESYWNDADEITVSGHSKGGNKAQFVAIHSGLAKECISFDGQGFSPEAINAFKNTLGADYEKRKKHICSFSSANDYVNVLGVRLVNEEHIYYFKSGKGIHYIESILKKSGKLRPQCEQGKLSAYMETISDDLMVLKPSVRQYAVLGIMNIFQKYLGEGTPVNGDSVSVPKTALGIGIALRSIIKRLRQGF